MTPLDSPDMPGPRPLLRHPEDLRSMIFVAMYGVLATTGWVVMPKSLAVLVPWVAVTAVSSWIVAVITHNTVHAPIFFNRTYNRLFQVWLSLSYGFPVSEFLPGHNLSHHKFAQKGGDLMRTTRVNFGWNLLNAVFFVPVVAPSITRANYRFVHTVGKSRPEWVRQLRLEVYAVWAVKLVLLAVDWRKAILFVFIPHLFAVWGITAVNYVQHDGCDEDSPYNHSRNFVGKWFNWLTFNNGFHGMHHVEPELHWTLLPAAHMAQLHPHIHPSLEQRSLAVYLFKTFLWPGRRVKYTGEPLVVVDPPAVSFLDQMSLGEVTAVLEA